MPESRSHDSFSASDVSGDVRGKVGIGLVREIEKHLRLSMFAHDVHGAFVVVALVLPFEDAVHQDLIGRGCGRDCFYKGVVLIQGNAQY